MGARVVIFLLPLVLLPPGYRFRALCVPDDTPPLSLFLALPGRGALLRLGAPESLAEVERADVEAEPCCHVKASFAPVLH
jgi:hypothetical protein